MSTCPQIGPFSKMAGFSATKPINKWRRHCGPPNLPVKRQSQSTRNKCEKINGPKADELEQESLADSYPENRMDLRHDPKPKDIKRRIVPLEVAKAAIHKLLHPAHPEALVAIIGISKSQENIREDAERPPQKKKLRVFRVLVHYHTRDSSSKQKNRPRTRRPPKGRPISVSRMCCHPPCPRPPKAGSSAVRERCSGNRCCTSTGT